MSYIDQLEHSLPELEGYQQIKNQSTFERTAYLIDQLIKINKEVRPTITMVAGSMEPPHYAMEFGTVAVDIGRRTGKTTYIKSRATPGCLVIVSSMEFLRHYRPEALKKGYDVCTAEMMSTATRGNTYHTIYVDEPGYVFNSKHPMIVMYQLLARNNDQTFILIGSPH